MPKQPQPLQDWIHGLTKEQLREALEGLLSETEHHELWRLGESGVLYWAQTGEPLVSGQDPFPDL